MALFRIIVLCFMLCFTASCSNSQPSISLQESRVTTGAERTNAYLPFLENKRVAIVANQTSTIGQTHLVDSLLQLGINIQKVFVPEHGFRGNVGAGDHVANEIDPKTGLALVSLYGSNKKPSQESLSNVDVILFDIQDVGVRFYTYISTLHYVLESAAEKGIPVVVLDRPNPNGHFIDGPVLEPEMKSFVGMDPIPIVYGMTIGELAQMMVGEKWFNEAQKCSLTVVPMEHWNHQSSCILPIAPSPNLATTNAINLYASLCLFEGTQVSVGRGTESPFEVIGYPTYPIKSFSFVPQDVEGKVKNPPHKGQTCYGLDLRKEQGVLNRFQLKWLIDMYQNCPNKSEFFSSPSFFDKLAGTKDLRKQLEQGMEESAIRQTWQPKLSEFASKRKKYLLYEDFK
jgi:uncharacterized protein YbbC (DUF1343 family)